MTPDVLLQRVRDRRRLLDEETGAARVVLANAQRLQGEVDGWRTEAELYTKAAAVLTSIGEERQAQAQHQIEELVTQGLRTIFGDDLSFHIVPAVRNKVPVVDFVIRSTLDDGTVVDTDILDARGGGLAATVGALLRIVTKLLARTAGPLCFDETFAHVSAEYLPAVADFLRQLVDGTDLQIIMVTHADVLADAADVRYRTTQTDGITRVQAI